MIILALSSDMDPVKYLNYINLQWRRRYYSFGQFAIQIPVYEYLPSMAYIFTDERPELGVIHSAKLNCTATGDYMMLSGYFYEYSLVDKIIYPIYRMDGTGETIARNMVSSFKDDLPISLGPVHSIGTITSFQGLGEELGKKLYELLKTQELSYRTRYDWANSQILFEVWQGKDRTQEQNTNSWVTFSDGFRNMGDVEATIDTSNYKNYAIVVGNGDVEDGNQITVIVDKSNGGHKQMIYLDKTSVKYDSDEQTLEDYKLQLAQAGEEELQKYAVINSVDFEPDTSRLKYMTDYDLGDKCDVIIDKLGKSYQTRITEVYEVFKNGQHTIKLTFGEVMPTVYQKARLK